MIRCPHCGGELIPDKNVREGFFSEGMAYCPRCDRLYIVVCGAYDPCEIEDELY